jgi:hypothetical protein
MAGAGVVVRIQIQTLNPASSAAAAVVVVVEMAEMLPLQLVLPYHPLQHHPWVALLEEVAAERNLRLPPLAERSNRSVHRQRHTSATLQAVVVAVGQQPSCLAGEDTVVAEPPSVTVVAVVAVGLKLARDEPFYRERAALARHPPPRASSAAP